MHIRQKAFLISMSALALAPLALFAWSGPPSGAACTDPPCPPGGNVAAPINVGTTDQVKNGGLGVNSLAVFGDSLFGGSAGSNAYLNFGATSGTNGYGIRDNAGLLEFKNSGGSWASLQSTIFTLAGAWMTSGNNIYNTNTGNVGIGTTNPNYRLHVSDNGLNTYAARITHTNTTQSNGLYITTATANGGDVGLSVASNNGSRPVLVTRNNGAVGVNTASPREELTVRNTLGSGGAEIFLEYDGLAGGTPYTYSLRSGFEGSFMIIDRMIAGTGTRLEIDKNGIVRASSFQPFSDMRLKQNIRTSPGLDTISRLRRVLFDWKKDGTPSAGVIAQEVEKVMPEAVSTSPDGMESVNYNALIAPLIEAVKEQQKEIDDLKAQLAEMNAHAAPSPTPAATTTIQ